MNCPFLAPLHSEHRCLQRSLPQAPPCLQRSLPQAQSRPCRSLPQAQSRPCRSLPHAQSRPCRSLPHAQSRPCRSLPQSLSHPCRSLLQARSRPCRSLLQAPTRPRRSLRWAFRSQSRPLQILAQPFAMKVGKPEACSLFYHIWTFEWHFETVWCSGSHLPRATTSSFCNLTCGCSADKLARPKKPFRLNPAAKVFATLASAPSNGRH